MASRRLTTLLEQWETDKSPALLVQILNQSLTEEEYALAYDLVTRFDGHFTPEIHFFAGEIAAKLDKHDEAIEHLLKVLESNPNHFKAKRLLDELGYNDTQAEDDDEKEVIESFKKIVIPDIPVDQTDSYRANRRKMFGILFFSILFVSALVALFVFWRPELRFFVAIDKPEETLYPLSWDDYQNRMTRLKEWVTKHKASNESRTTGFYLSAYSLIDFYLLDKDKDLLSTVRFYFALTREKTEQMKLLNRYIETKNAPEGLEYLNMLERNYPVSKDEINRYPVVVPKQIDNATVRQALYAALMLFRQNKLQKASSLISAILARFPNSEIAEKLSVLIAAKSVENNPTGTVDKEKVLRLLRKFKTSSPERHLLSEAWVTLGRATGDFTVQEEGFYLGCPGSYWCAKVVNDFLRRKNIHQARRMAEYMKNKRGVSRDESDIKLVLRAAYADNDFGSCYFSYRELKQFFPRSIDKDTAFIAARCSENNGYFEEAEELYRSVGGQKPSPELAAKIAEMNWLVHEDASSLKTLADIYEKNKDNLAILRSYLAVVRKTKDVKRTLVLLDALFKKVSADERPRVIDMYIAVGANAPALKKLQTFKDEQWAQDKMYTIYCRNLQFNLADKLPHSDYSYKPVCSALEQAWKLISEEQYDDARSMLTKLQNGAQQCDPAIIYLLAEIYRRRGESQLTFSMIDSMLECNKNYLPGLVFTAGIAFYQGDFTSAEKGIHYVFEHEDIFSVVPGYYHNELVLILGDMLISRGKTAQLLPFLKKNMLFRRALRPVEQDKLDDLYDKLSPRNRARLKRFILRNFKRH